MLALERERTERSRRRFVLMLLESDNLLRGGNNEQTLGKVLESLHHSTQETDVKGWYKAGSVIGVIYTEIGAADGRSVAYDLLSKILEVLGRTLSIEQINQIRLSYHVFPEDWESGGSADLALYPDLLNEPAGKRAARALKRCMDVVGSLAALILLAPVLAAIAVAIKLTSRGPVLFQQTRMGLFGRKFTFLKFRSMHPGGDDSVHEEYVKRLISGSGDCEQPTGREQVAYKLTNHPRVTPLGRFLRRTSLDELPQFYNVLKGEMSLVGPRPPIPYEFRHYDLWHRRRLLAVRPGITGLWQVEGRSRMKFEDMVRLDLTYASSWSLWMDVKILFRTPGAVLDRSGAY